MTYNHLLLYRLAELMLKNEQHILPVDMLFDDEQIGDFVKSIQIDSPYQQMLIDGVLTESVREENLYVAFTVEGYFHYVLGEVIYNQTKDQSAEALKIIVEKNKLKGAKEGVEQCLIRDVENDDLKRLMWLIDEGGSLLNSCIVPLASSFLKVNSFYNDDDTHPNTEYSIQLENIVNLLISKQTENDIKVLQKSITRLINAQKQNLVSALYKIINDKVKPDKLINAILYVKSIEFIPKEYRIQKINDLIDAFKPELENKEISNFYSIVSEQYRINGNYQIALEYLEKSWKILTIIKGRTKQLKIKYFDSLAKIYQGNKNYSKAINNFKKTLSLSLNKYDEHSSAVAISNANLGIAYSLNGNYDEAIEYLEKSIKILTRVFGMHHINISKIYMMYASTLIAKKEFEKAIDIYQKSISIELRVYGHKSKYVAILYQAIGMTWELKKDYGQVLFYFNKSLSIYLKNDKIYFAEIAEMYGKIGSIYCDKLCEYDKAIQFLEISIERNTIIYGKSHLNISENLIYLGNAWKSKFNYDNAIKCFEDAISIIIKIKGEHDKRLISIYQSLAICFNKIKDNESAILFYNKALEIVQNSTTERNKIEGDIYNLLGLNYLTIKDYDNALYSFEKSLSIRLDLNGINHADVAICYNNLASVSFNNANYKQAEELYKKALNIKLNIYGEHHLQLIKTYINLGKTLTKLLDYSQAIEYFKLANSIQKSDDLLFIVAGCYEELQQYEMSFNFFIESAEMSKSNHGLEYHNTKKYSKKCLDFARIHNMSGLLPQWIKNTEYDI
jgi:tetratricopeptide (TPR) repeat protein